jgi:virulence factor
MEPSPEAPLRIAIVGGGSVAQKAYLPLLRNWRSARIVGVASRSQDTVDKIRKDWQIDFGTTNLSELIDKKPHAAFVLTPRATHEMLTRQLLEAGIDVYLEKPATESSEATRQLADLAASKERILFVGFNRRYALFYQQAKGLFHQRRIQMCIIEKHRPSAYHTSLYNNYLEDTIHQIDLLRFCCGDVEVAHTSFEMREGRLYGAMSAVLLKDGGIATVITSLQAGSWQERLTLHGESLSVEVTAFRELRVKYPDREEIFGPDRPGKWIPEMEERGFHGAIDHFFDCVRTRKKPLTDGHEACRTRELVEALVTCAGEKTQITPQF